VAHHPCAVWDWKNQVLIAEEGGDEMLEHTILDAHFWPKVLHPTPYTFHPTPYTLHPTHILHLAHKKTQPPRTLP